MTEIAHSVLFSQIKNHCLLVEHYFPDIKEGNSKAFKKAAMELCDLEGCLLSLQILAQPTKHKLLCTCAHEVHCLAFDTK